MDDNKKNKTNNELNENGIRFVHQFHEYVDIHDTDRTLLIIQDLHKAGHIEFKDSELDYCDFMEEEWDKADKEYSVKNHIKESLPWPKKEMN